MSISSSVCDDVFSDVQGHYSLYPDQSGGYEIEFNVSGYQTLRIPNFSIQEMKSSVLDVKMTVPGLVSIVTERLSVTEINKSYYERIKIQGGLFPYSFQLLKGELPSGLFFASETGEITGSCQVPGV